MNTNLIGTNVKNRPEEDILEDFWDAFLAEDTLRSIDLQDISVTVEAGHVFLSGYVEKDLHYERMEATARLVPGVWAVHNHLVTDESLTVQVSQSLARDESLRSLVFPVYSRHGWIALGGFVPNRELQQAAEIAAAQVATVRGVITLPKLMGDTEEEPRQAVQPAIGARVYTQNGMEGWVSQVIIRPENRLVRYAVVRLNLPKGCGPAGGEVLVPVEAMEVVSTEEIILKREVPALKCFLGFFSGNYPIAPLTWEPPYPYPVGRVRWTREEIHFAVKGSRTQHANTLSGEKKDIPEKKSTR